MSNEHTPTAASCTAAVLPPVAGLWHTRPLKPPALCSGWVIKDWLVYWPNEVGLLVGLFFTMSCYGLADTKVGRRASPLAAAALLARVPPQLCAL